MFRWQSNLHSPNKFNGKSNMLKPVAILTQIPISFTFSIVSAVYQRNLLMVRSAEINFVLDKLFYSILKSTIHHFSFCFQYCMRARLFRCRCDDFLSACPMYGKLDKSLFYIYGTPLLFSILPRHGRCRTIDISVFYRKVMCADRLAEII